MSQWIYTLVYLLLESFSCRRDAQVRFLKEENQILRSRIPSQRLILDPEERTRLLALGAELKHQVKGVVSIVQYHTYQRWVKEQEVGIKPGRVGRPRKISDEVRQAIIRIAKENSAWGYLRIVGELLKLRCPVGKTSVRRILREEGLYPKPRPDRTDRADIINPGTSSSSSTSTPWWPATSSARQSGRWAGNVMPIACSSSTSGHGRPGSPRRHTAPTKPG